VCILFTGISHSKLFEVLHAWATWVLQKECEHISLHFDGLMIDKRRVGDPSTFAADTAAHVEKCTGVKIIVRRKPLQCFFNWIKEKGNVNVIDTTSSLRVLLKRGNCIPCAMAHATDQHDFFAGRCGEPSEDNLRAHRCGTRLYADCLRMLRGCEKQVSTTLHAEVGLCLQNGAWVLVHGDMEHTAHCVAIHCVTPDNCVVYDGLSSIELSTAEARVV